VCGEKCGCFYEARCDDWDRHEYRNIKQCGSKTSEILNLKIQYEQALDKKMNDIDFERVPIKYYYDMFGVKTRVFNKLHKRDVERYKLHKHGSRYYYCCKNRVDYYLNRPPEDHFIEAGLEDEFCEKKEQILQQPATMVSSIWKLFINF
jgi:hypothetical protein